MSEISNDLLNRTIGALREIANDQGDIHGRVAWLCGELARHLGCAEETANRAIHFLIMLQVLSGPKSVTLTSGAQEIHWMLVRPNSQVGMRGGNLTVVDLSPE